LPDIFSIAVRELQLRHDFIDRRQRESTRVGSAEHHAETHTHGSADNIPAALQPVVKARRKEMGFRHALVHAYLPRVSDLLVKVQEISGTA
jgi:hypothetical protein